MSSCIAIFQESIFGGDGRFSLIAGSRVPEPFQEVERTLLWLHILAAIVLGLLGIWVSALLADVRPARWRVALPGLVALAVLIATAPAVLREVQPTTLLTARSAGDTECIKTGTAELCYWTDERSGAVLLEDALARGRARLVGVDLPAAVAQEGILHASRGAFVVADMPADKTEANYYVAEFVVEAAGCSIESRSSADLFMDLMEYIASSLASTAQGFDPKRLSLLANC